MDEQTADLLLLQAFVTDDGLIDGDRLPAEQQLAERLNISRNRVRRLLKAAETDGLIWRHVGKGTFLGSRSVTQAFAGLSDLVSPIEIFEARLVLEPRLAALAAARATPPEIEEMERCLVAMHDADAFASWSQIDLKLHRLVAKAAKNQLLLTLYETVRECSAQGMKSRIHDVYSGRWRAETDREHELWLQAIAAHDPENAERLMREHIQSVRNRILGNMT